MVNNIPTNIYPLLKERNIPMRVKTTIYTPILRPLLTYGCECWVLTTKLKSRLQAAEMRVLRLIVGVTRLDRLRNYNIRREFGIESITEITERNQIRWYGHLLLMPENRRPLTYYRWTPEGRRPVGRPRKRWRDAIREAVADRGETLGNIEENELYRERQEWRNFARHHRWQGRPYLVHGEKGEKEWLKHVLSTVPTWGENKYKKTEHVGLSKFAKEMSREMAEDPCWHVTDSVSRPLDGHAQPPPHPHICEDVKKTKCLPL